MSLQATSEKTLPTGAAGRRHGWRRALYVLKTNPSAAVGLAVLALFIGTSLFGSYLTSFQYDELNLLERLRTPSSTHWLGTDQFGRDILSRVLRGGRVSLAVGFGGTLLAGLVGTGLGLWAGWAGGKFDSFLMRVMDVILAFPSIILAIGLAAITGPGLDKLIVIIAVSRIPQFARLVRGSVLTVRRLEFVEAAAALGQRPALTIWKHILPNCLVPLLVYASFSMASAINTEAALSFLGLGIQPPEASWGNMLSDARQFILVAPWMAIGPGLAITATVLSANLVGDGLRDMLDPKLMKGGGH